MGVYGSYISSTLGTNCKLWKTFSRNLLLSLDSFNFTFTAFFIEELETEGTVYINSESGSTPKVSILDLDDFGEFSFEPYLVPYYVEYGNHLSIVVFSSFLVCFS